MLELLLYEKLLCESIKIIDQLRSVRTDKCQNLLRDVVMG